MEKLDIITGALRNLLPTHFVDIVKQEQQDAWTRQQS